MAEISTLHDSNVHLVGFSDQIDILAHEHAPLIKLFGASNANLSKLDSVKDFPSTKVEWFDYPLAATTSVLTGSPGTSTTVSVDTGHGVRFRKGDILLNESTLEKYLVQSVATDALTVERGYGATSNTSASATQVVRKVGRVMPEGYPTYETGFVGQTTDVYNWAQVISQAVQVTKTEQIVKKRLISDLMKFNIARLFNNGGTAGELVKALQNTFYYGERIPRTTIGGTVVSTMGAMGGFDTFVTDGSLVTANLARSLQKSDINTKMRIAKDRGGRITHAICDAQMFEVLDDLFPTEDRDYNSSVGGNEPVKTIRTTHGKLKLVEDYMAPSGTIYLTNPAYVGWLPLREFHYQDYREIGDNFATDVVGEYTFFVRHGNESHAKIAGIAL